MAKMTLECLKIDTEKPHEVQYIVTINIFLYVQVVLQHLFHFPSNATQLQLHDRTTAQILQSCKVWLDRNQDKPSTKEGLWMGLPSPPSPKAGGRGLTAAHDGLKLGELT